MFARLVWMIILLSSIGKSLSVDRQLCWMPAACSTLVHCNSQSHRSTSCHGRRTLSYKPGRPWNNWSVNWLYKCAWHRWLHFVSARKCKIVEFNLELLIGLSVCKYPKDNQSRHGMYYDHLYRLSPLIFATLSPHTPYLLTSICCLACYLDTTTVAIDNGGHHLGLVHGYIWDGVGCPFEISAIECIASTLLSLSTRVNISVAILYAGLVFFSS